VSGATAEPEPAAPSETRAARPESAAAAPSQHWETIVSMVMEERPALGAVLQHGVAMKVTVEQIVLGFPPGSFFGQQAEALDGRRSIAEAATKVLGARPAVEVTVAQEGSGTRTLVDMENERREARIEAKKERALSHPLVVEARRVFGVDPREMNVRVELE
jgi:DNA polymerase-3 subunit gamma/tau